MFIEMFAFVLSGCAAVTMMLVSGRRRVAAKVRAR